MRSTITQRFAVTLIILPEQLWPLPLVYNGGIDWITTTSVLHKRSVVSTTKQQCASKQKQAKEQQDQDDDSTATIFRRWCIDSS